MQTLRLFVAVSGFLIVLGDEVVISSRRLVSRGVARQQSGEDFEDFPMILLVFFMHLGFYNSAGFIGVGRGMGFDVSLYTRP